ncbi:MAG: hypothetical protein CFE37_05380 [Alphaproteobacteria bacterium PA4]|nr:MAG: hypothetical protein CFE37_05380 [Alphaproteobacteria bacterium PA4]
MIGMTTRALTAVLLAIATASSASAAMVTVSANAGNTIGAGPFTSGPYTRQHQILNTLPVTGGAPGSLTTVINGVSVVQPGSPNTRFAVAVAEPQSSASAYADLRQGKIGAFAGSTPSGFASSSASIADTLNFTIAGANADTVTALRFRISLHATALSAYGLMGFSGYTWLGTIGSGSPFNVQPSVIAHQSWVEGTTRYFDLTYNLRGANPVFGAGLVLEAIAGGGDTSDFSNTARLRVLASPGVTYTSQSGQFLTAAGAVPEPASWSLLILGFGLVGTAARRGRLDAVVSATAFKP